MNERESRNSEVIEKINKAIRHAIDISRGIEKWTMRVPANPDMDSDLVIVDALRAARDLLEKPSETGAWISVEDRLPEERIRVLAWDGLIVLDSFYGVGSNRLSDQWSVKQWRDSNSNDEARRHAVTHWMPMPKGPK